MSNYNPHECGMSLCVYGVFICRLETVPCALHKGEKCYMQRSDEAVIAMANALKKEDVAE